MCAVLKYDVSGVESSGGGLQPKPGVYKGEITKFDLTKPDGKDRRFEIIFKVVGNKEFGGSQLYEYVNVESEAAAWKLRQLTDALGLKPKGSINTEKHIGDVLQLQVQGDTYNGEYRARVGRMMALPEDAEVEPDEDEEEIDEDEEGAEEGDDGYDEMSLKELRAALKERGLPTRGAQDVLIERLREADAETEEGDEEEPDADEDAEAEDDGDAETYDDWDLAELKEELKNRGLRTVGSKKALVARLEKDDQSEDGPF